MQRQRAGTIELTSLALYCTRRRVATGLAVAVAVGCGYHAIFGQNGITAYAEKRSEDRALATRIEKLSEENARLQQHVDHLASDPGAIEHEARERLHYTRRGEVIYTLEDRPHPDAPTGDTRPTAIVPKSAAH